MKFQLRSAAKINLSLDLLSRRADGYHELSSVVHTVGWVDEIELQLTRDERINVSCADADLCGESNLCARAMRAWNVATGDVFGARITLHKNIPTGAGLGGGSGNAAAILKALQRASAIQISDGALEKIGAQLGADVPLFVRGGALLMQGIGEQITPLAPLAGWVLLVKPLVSLATPPVYRAWDASELTSENRTPALLQAWQSSDVAAVAGALGNDFARVVDELTPAPARCVELLKQSGALGAQMSGSGSACFGLFADENAAREAHEQLKIKLAKDVLTQGAMTRVAPLVARGVEFAAAP